MSANLGPRRSRASKRPFDPDDDLEPREGLWRFAYAWFVRAAEPVIEAEPAVEAATPAVAEHVADAVVAASAAEERAPTEVIAPGPKRRRSPKRDAVPPMTFRRRAFAWLVERRAARDANAATNGSSASGAMTGPAQLSDFARAHLKGVLESLVFASEHPLAAKELARIARAELRHVKALLAELVTEYHGRGFRLDEIAGGFVFRTSPAFAPFVREQVAKKPMKMSRAQIETLAIVAYRQPVTRPEVDDVRGVDSGAVLKSLLERDLVRILGKKDEPGRPMLYGTTPDFLEFFGLKALGDLPTLREFTELSDDSRRAYEREMGEEPVDYNPPADVDSAGFMGGEGVLRASERDEAEPTDGDGDAVVAEPPRPRVEDFEDPPEEDAVVVDGVADETREEEGPRSAPPVADEPEEATEVATDVAEDQEAGAAESDGDGDEEEDDDEDEDDEDDEDDDEDDDDEDDDEDDDDDE